MDERSARNLRCPYLPERGLSRLAHPTQSGAKATSPKKAPISSGFKYSPPEAPRSDERCRRGREEMRFPLKHRRYDHVGRTVPVVEGLDVDDHLLAHLGAALPRGGTHMRQQNHVRQFAQAGVHLAALLEHVEACP